MLALASLFEDHPKLFRLFKAQLEVLANRGKTVSFVSLKEALGVGDLSDEELLSALLHLCDAGMLKPVRDTLNPKTREYELVRSNWDGKFTEAETLVRYLPEMRKRFSGKDRYGFAATLPESLENVLGKEAKIFAPTFSEIRRMIHETKKEVGIMTPFLDAAAITDLSPFIVDALRRGVKVRIVTRYLRGEDTRNEGPLRALAEQARAKGCAEDLSFYEYRYMGTDKTEETFHAKLLVTDLGKDAYVGSANFTDYGFGKRLELGVCISGPSVQGLYRLFSEVLNLADRCEL